MRARRIKSVLLVGLLLVTVNLPLLNQALTSWRIERSGVDATADVLGGRIGQGGDGWWVIYRLPSDLDPDGTEFETPVTQAAYDEACRTERIEVRALPDLPSAHVVTGQVTSRTLLWVTLAADAFVVLLAVLLTRVTRAFRPEPLRIEALEDLAAADGGAGVEDVGTDLVVVRGPVVSADAHEVVLDVGDRLLVVVVLDGRANPVARGDAARARGRVLT